MITSTGLTIGKYNRSNYLYDREMRLKQELHLMEYRTEKAELWREDIEDLVGLTELRMGSYMWIAPLGLDMCVGLFCEGRMEPGTPPWLISMYMLTLGGAFMYMLMAIWLAMHAAVVAQCSSVRILTQFVRLPVPTWPQLEAARTYASNFEEVGAKNVMRVPFVGRSHENKIPRKLKQTTSGTADATSSSASAPASTYSAAAGSARSGFLQRLIGPRSAPTPAQGSRVPPASVSGSSELSAMSESQQVGGDGADSAAYVDTFHTERMRDDIYELMRVPNNLAHHVELAKRASRYYKCYDVYVRLSMSFGWNQLLSSLCYFSMGYCSIMDTAMSASWVIVCLALGISFVLVELDMVMSHLDKFLAYVLIAAGPILTSVAVYAWMIYGIEYARCVKMAYAMHGLWLLFAMRKVQAEKQSNGSVLPVKFRPTLYLDIFGWVDRKKSSDRKEDSRRQNTASALPEFELASGSHRNDEPQGHPPTLQQQVNEDINILQSDRVQAAMEPHDRQRVERLAKTVGQETVGQTFEPSSSSSQVQKRKVRIKGYSNVGTEIPYYVDPESGEISYDVDEEASTTKKLSVRTITRVEQNVEALKREREEKKVRRDASQEEADPFGWDDYETESAGLRRFFRGVTKLDDEFCSLKNHPTNYYDIHATFPHVDKKDHIMRTPGQLKPGKVPHKLFRLATLMLCVLWAAMILLPLRLGKKHNKSKNEPALSADVMDLGEGKLIEVEWPSHDGFIPRAMSCDDTGQNLIVADDFGIYAAQLPGARNAQWPAKVALKKESSVSARTNNIEGISTAEDFIHDAESLLPEPVRDALLGSSIESVKPSAIFERVPICEALEGQIVLDIDLMCPRDGKSLCRVLVLHGRNLTECPLIVPGNRKLPGAKSEMSTNIDKVARSWVISGDWLNRLHDETIEDVAVNGDCIANSTYGEDATEKGTFGHNLGCVVVGTSMGRIVQLRRHLDGSDTLVPDRTLLDNLMPGMTSAQLHIMHGRIIMALRSFKDGGHRTFQALSVEQGHKEGEWRLPLDVKWLEMSGSSIGLYFLGRNTEQKAVQLWRFEAPSELKSYLE